MAFSSALSGAAFLLGRALFALVVGYQGTLLGASGGAVVGTAVLGVVSLDA